MHPGGVRRPSDPSGTHFSLGPAPSRSAAPGQSAMAAWQPPRFSCPSWARAATASPKETPTAVRRGHCPSWARTRTLLIQRGEHKPLNSGNLQPFTRARVTRCWSLLSRMLYSADLCAFRCRSLPIPHTSPPAAAQFNSKRGKHRDGAAPSKRPRRPARVSSRASSLGIPRAQTGAARPRCPQ